MSPQAKGFPMALIRSAHSKKAREKSIVNPIALFSIGDRIHIKKLKWERNSFMQYTSSERKQTKRKQKKKEEEENDRQTFL